MTSQEYFDLSEPFFMVVTLEPVAHGRIVLFQNPTTVDTYVRNQHLDTLMSISWVRVIGVAVTTTDIWHGYVRDYTYIDRVWKDESISMHEKHRRETQQ